jgi:hypothetical protein
VYVGVGPTFRPFGLDMVELYKRGKIFQKRKCMLVCPMFRPFGLDMTKQRSVAKEVVFIIVYCNMPQTFFGIYIHLYVFVTNNNSK